MSMMHSATTVILLMAFLVLVAAGVFLGVRLLGAREVESDHPHDRSPR